MNTFNVRPTDWHYRFLIFSGMSDYEIRADCRDFCSYWRKVLTSMLGWLVLACICATLVCLIGGLIAMLFSNLPPMIAVSVMSAMIVFFGVFWLIVTGHTRRILRRIDPSYRPRPSLIATRYKSWKERYCPMLEIEE